MPAACRLLAQASGRVKPSAAAVTGLISDRQSQPAWAGQDGLAEEQDVDGVRGGWPGLYDQLRGSNCWQ